MSSTKTPNKQQQQNALPDAFSLFKPSWQAVRLNIDTFVLLMLFPVGLGMLTALLFTSASRSEVGILDALAITTLIVNIGIGLFAMAALIITEMESALQKRISFGETIQKTKVYFWRLTGLLLLASLITIVGFILLIVPGVFAIQRLLLSPYLLVDKNLGVMETIKHSRVMAKVKANAPAVWGVVLVLLAINVISFIPGVGWLVSTALTIAYFCAPAIRYLQLAKRT